MFPLQRTGTHLVNKQSAHLLIKTQQRTRPPRLKAVAHTSRATASEGRRERKRGARSNPNPLPPRHIAAVLVPRYL
jgi:hypothetical protein